jgi:hypothetical protein
MLRRYRYGDMFLKVLFCGVLSCDLKANGSVLAKYRLNFSVVKQW